MMLLYARRRRRSNTVTQIESQTNVMRFCLPKGPKGILNWHCYFVRRKREGGKVFDGGCENGMLTVLTGLYL